MTSSQADHRGFLNEYYGISRHFYDLTRKYYLLGRDNELDSLLDERWDSLIEVGPGTGRNLTRLNKARPRASLGGIEASDEMLKHAKQRCSFARLEHGFAESCNYGRVLGKPPDRILFSYCLSMVQDKGAALENAVAALAPGGQVVVIDFADFAGLPRPVRNSLTAFLNKFHVHPVPPQQLSDWGAHVQLSRGRYYVRARFHAR